MKFGLFYELQLPRPLDDETWDPDAERRVFDEMFEQVEYAEDGIGVSGRVGHDLGWLKLGFLLEHDSEEIEAIAQCSRDSYGIETGELV